LVIDSYPQTYQRQALFKLFIFLQHTCIWYSIISHNLSGIHNIPVFRRCYVIMLTDMSRQIYF